MWAPLWLQIVLGLAWGLLSLPLFSWAWRVYRRWQSVLRDENLRAGKEPDISGVAVFTLVGTMAMLILAGILTLAMAGVMNGLASFAWRPEPDAIYFERPRLILYILLAMLPAIILSVAPIDAFGRAVYRSKFDTMLLHSSAFGDSVGRVRACSVGLRWFVLVCWVGVLLSFAASLRWFTQVGPDAITLGKHSMWTPLVVEPSEIKAVYGVDSFIAPSGDVVTRYHPVIELHNGDHIDFSGEAGGEPEPLARVLEAWADRHDLPFNRVPAYPG
jgi:hypothetical protein